MAAARSLLSLLLLLTLSSSSSSSSWTKLTTSRLQRKQAPPAAQEAAARSLLQRLLPTHVSSFELRVIPKGVCGGSSCFFLKNSNESDFNGPKIVITGTSAVEVASGLHWYLKYWCGAHISWDKTGGIQKASIPSSGNLPPLKDSVVKRRPVPWSYYQNVVTSSYSFVWWDWKRWEKEIDWMALQGVNLPLAFTGQEAIWQIVFKGYNISNEDLSSFFGGPAFLAWARMGNLHAWGGPLSQNWLDQQLSLQKRILSRMRELGMIPVLPSFSGNVPAVFQKLFPAANITRLGDWNTVNGDPRWCCTFLLDPSDPLFIELGAAFLRQQMKEYGDITDIYSCDTFNENEPPTKDPVYISSLGAAVYNAMYKANENAIWLMQGWLFASDTIFWKPPQMKALLHSVPYGKMIVLDLFADVKPVWSRSSQFYGVPYIWCMLHNFGGNVEMYGLLDAISSGPVDAHRSHNSTMIGLGMCMEGIEQNPVVYELMSEMAYRREKVQVKDWLKSYSQRRYGKSEARLEAAWQILYHTVYNCTDGIEDHNKDFIVQLPDLDPSGAAFMPVVQYIFQKDVSIRSLRETIFGMPKPHLWYSAKEAIDALKLFIDGGNNVKGSITFRYDLLDLTRQVLAKFSNKVFLDAIIAYQNRDINSLNFHRLKFMELIKDIDDLLASDDNFLLGTWLESSKRRAMSYSEKLQYEWNARTQITMWYDNTNTNQSKLHDYANKYWSGLLKSYYLPRASTYFSYMMKSLRKNESFALEEWRKEWISYSSKWQAGQELYPTKAKGDALVIARRMVQKYFSI